MELPVLWLAFISHRGRGFLQDHSNWPTLLQLPSQKLEKFTRQKLNKYPHLRSCFSSSNSIAFLSSASSFLNSVGMGFPSERQQHNIYLSLSITTSHRNNCIPYASILKFPLCLNINLRGLVKHLPLLRCHAKQAHLLKYQGSI